MDPDPESLKLPSEVGVRGSPNSLLPALAPPVSELFLLLFCELLMEEPLPTEGRRGGRWLDFSISKLECRLLFRCCCFLLELCFRLA